MAETLHLKMRNQETVTLTKLLNLCEFIATSDLCKHTSSEVHYALSDCQRGKGLEIVEHQLLLLANSKYWYINYVQSVLE